MRIGIDVRSLLDAQPTGVGMYGRHIVRELLRQGGAHEFRLYASGLRGKLNTRDLGVEAHPRARLVWIRRPSKLQSLSTVALKQPVIDQRLGGLDVFFSPNVNFTTLSPRVPHVLTVHDLSFLRFPEFFSAWRQAWHRAVRARAQIRAASHLVCDAISTANDLTHYLGVPRSRVSVVPLAVDDTVPDPQAIDAARTRYGIGEHYLVAVGTIEPRKHFEHLLQAFDELAPRHNALQLVIIGPRGWRSGLFTHTLRTMQHRARVHLIGFTSDVERQALVAGAQLLCAPSAYEGFGLPVLQGLRLGVPVVTTAVSSLPEVGGDATVLIDPERPAELAQALEQVLRDPDLRASLIWHGRGLAEQYRWQETGRQTLAVLEGVVHNRTWLAQSAPTVTTP